MYVSTYVRKGRGAAKDVENISSKVTSFFFSILAPSRECNLLSSYEFQALNTGGKKPKAL